VAAGKLAGKILCYRRENFVAVLASPLSSQFRSQESVNAAIASISLVVVILSPADTRDGKISVYN